MKSRLLLAACLCLASAPCSALFGRAKGASANKITLLWVPSESFSDWSGLSEAFRRYDELRLTVGLTADMATPRFLAQMKPWIGQGRLETALRLSGDPLLPLITDNPMAPRPHDGLQRLASERAEFEERAGMVPDGFVPGGGAVNARLLSDLKKMGFKWAAAGDYGEDWNSADGLTVIPLKTVRSFGQALSPQNLTLPDYPAPAAFLIDEADAFAPEGSLLTLLGALSAGKRPTQPWSTLSEASAARDLTAASSGTWPTWLGGYGPWTDNPEQKAAWKMYADAARALEKYQNSGAADLQALENAGKELYAAQAGRYFRALDRSGVLSDLEKADQGLRAHLAEIYRLTRQSVPADLSASLLSARSGAAATARFKKGDTWLEFENTPSRVLSSGDLWTILGLRVEWDDKEVTLTYRMGRLENDVAAPHGFGRLLVDTYIDLNHVVGAGSTRLLEGRGYFIQSRDAWEFALTLSGWSCALYRFDPRGKPVKAAECNPKADLRSGILQVKLGREVLRGNPARWGYTAAVFDADKDSASQSPARPTRRADGATILGLLEQDAGTGKQAIPERLAAVRAP